MELTNEELETRLTKKVNSWCTGNEDCYENLSYKIISKKIDYKNYCGHFLCKTYKSLVVIYVWYSLFNDRVILSQDGEVDIDDIENVAKQIFDISLHRFE